jgi:predicted HicB family RNase H-like nuclease
MAKSVLLKDFPPDLHQRAKIQAVREDTSLKALVIKALEEYLEKVGG